MVNFHNTKISLLFFTAFLGTTIGAQELYECIDGKQYYFSQISVMDSSGAVLSGQIDVEKSKLLFNANGGKYDYMHLGINANSNGYDYRFRLKNAGNIPLEWVDGKTRTTSSGDLIITDTSFKVLSGWTKNALKDDEIVIQGNRINLEGHDCILTIDPKTRKITDFYNIELGTPYLKLKAINGFTYVFASIDGNANTGRITGGRILSINNRLFVAGNEIPNSVGLIVNFSDQFSMDGSGPFPSVKGLWSNKLGLPLGNVLLTGSNGKKYKFIINKDVYFDRNGMIGWGKYIDENGVEMNYAN